MALRPRWESRQRTPSSACSSASLPLALAVVLVVATIGFGFLVVEKLERITQAAERTEAKLDRIIEATAPVGRAAVEKGAEALRKMDADDLGKSAAQGLKDLADAAKKRLIEHLEKKQEEDGEQPN